VDLFYISFATVSVGVIISFFFPKASPEPSLSKEPLLNDRLKTVIYNYFYN
jgi:hypothetical protein